MVRNNTQYTKKWLTSIDLKINMISNYYDLNNCIKLCEGKVIPIKSLTQKIINAELVNRIKLHDKAKNYYTNKYNLQECDWPKIYTLPLTVGAENIIKELQYKIIHKYIATEKLLFKMNKSASRMCNFCNQEVQDIEHLFWNCIIVKNIWFKFIDAYNEAHSLNIMLTEFDIILGYGHKNEKFLSYGRDLNCLILYIKKYIYDCKIGNKNPLWTEPKTYLKYKTGVNVQVKNVKKVYFGKI